MRDFHSSYLPFKWRGFWDFGTGALGDMGCHIIETPFSVLDLGYPKEAEASCTTVWVDDFVVADYSHSCPPSSKIHLKFDHPDHGEIALNWFDGGIMPNLPDELKDGETIGASGGGTVMYGEKGILVADVYSRNARLLPSETMDLFNAPEPSIPRIEGNMGGHIANFVKGCLEGKPTSSPFSRSGPLTEIVLMGNLAVRAFQYRKFTPSTDPNENGSYSYPGRRKLHWDGENMEITNYPEANQWVKREYREGWSLE
jgi:predicted dehydrogenase